MSKMPGEWWPFKSLAAANAGEIKHQVDFLNKVFAFAGIVAFGMGFIRWQENALMGAIDFCFAGLAAAVLLYLRRYKEQVRLVSSIALILSFLLFFSIFVLAPYNTTRSSLFFLLLASAFFLKGRQAGFLWLVFILLSIALTSVFSGVETAYSLIDKFTLGAYLVALFFIIDSYEAIKEEQQQHVKQINMQLEERIAERTRELRQTNLQLEQLNEALDTQVKQRTQQLLAAQDELVRKEKLALLGQIADTVGHELRNPLGVMNNAVYYLQTVLDNADKTTAEYLAIIKDEIADAERIVSDLLDAVRSKSPRPELVDIAGLIGQTLRKCSIPAAVSVKLEIPPTLAAFRADPMHLHQVLWNLITNAVEAMPQGGALEITANETPQQLRISVKDSGTGMTAQQQAQLFEPLFTTKARRIGLGLVVVKNLTELNGGSVAVETAPGRGSVFTVTLPRSS